MRFWLAAALLLTVTMPAAAGWQKVSPAWDAHQAVRAIAVLDDAIYVGLATGTTGGADVWRRDAAGAWAKIGGDGVNGSWAAAAGKNSVSNLTVFNGLVYASIGYTSPVVYVFDPATTTWTLIGGPGVAGTWTSTQYEWAYQLEVFNGSLYVCFKNAVSNATKRPAVWRYNGGTSWTKVWEAPNATTGLGVYTMTTIGSYLYWGLNGMTGNNAPGGQLYRYDGSTVQQVAGGGINGSWTLSGNSTKIVEALIEHGGRAWIGLGYLPNNQAHSIWSCALDTLQCQQEGDRPASWQWFHVYNHLLSLPSGSLILGAGGYQDGNAAHAHASTWRLDELTGQWIEDSIGAWPYRLPGTTATEAAWVYRLQAYGDGYLAGTAGGTAGASLWLWTPDLAVQSMK